jgi:glycosyltransferase involved in cell wall biosynthesis
LRNESPSGAPHSRNAAILAARGDFVTGLDDDDQFLPDRIAAFVSYWHLLASISQPVSFLYSQEIVEGPGSAVSVSRKPGSADYNAMFRSNAVGNQIFAPKEAFIEAGLFDAQMPAWQDLDMFMRILKRRGPARLLDVPLYRLNLQPRSDRISRQSKATLYSAYTRLAKKCVGATAAMKQELFLQLFEEYYGFSPRLQDVFEFAKYGVKQGNNLRFLKLILRRSLHLR